MKFMLITALQYMTVNGSKSIRPTTTMTKYLPQTVQTIHDSTLPWSLAAKITEHRSPLEQNF